MQQVLLQLLYLIDTSANVATTNAISIITTLISDVVISHWIIDTGASNHMIHSLRLMNQYKYLDDKQFLKVNLPTGSQVPISHIGESLVLKNKLPKEVLFRPEFNYNLLSVSQFTKQLQCVVLFFPDFYIFQELFSGRVLGIGKEDQGLYLLKTEFRHNL